MTDDQETPKTAGNDKTQDSPTAASGLDDGGAAGGLVDQSVNDASVSDRADGDAGTVSETGPGAGGD